MLVYTSTPTTGTQNTSAGAGDFTTFSFPAAVGGLNRRDAKAEMPISDANILTNVIPYPTFCAVRRGYEEHATGIMGSVETLMEWAGPTSRKLFAAADTVIYDVTSSGAASSSLTSLTNARWQWVNFATSGGSFLVIANGADSVRNYDGSNWTTPAITGVTSADLIYVTQWKSRLWFVEKNSKNAWYLPVSSIAGAATKLDLGPQFKRGGYLVAIGTVSYDSGTGPDDLIAFLSDQGEVAIYQGTDPSSATTFSIVNRFIIGSPIGRRSLIQVGGDLAVISVDGIVSMIAMSNKDRSASSQAAITDKIQDLFNDYARAYRGNFGWQGQIYPLGSYVLFNIPFSSTQYNQLVMNTETGSWCLFEGMNGSCWGLLSDDIYFGGDGVVYKADTGFQDNGGIISFDYQGAFNNFGQKSRKKHFQMIRSLMQTNGSPTILQTMNVDFSDVEPTGTLSPTAPPASTWDSGLWDTALWGGTNSFYQWANVGQIGAWGTPRLKGALNGISLQLNSFEVKMTVGGVI
jgi:hypothetical protein